MTLNSKYVSCLALLAGFFSLTASVTWAQTTDNAINPLLNDRFTLRIGSYFEKVDSSVAKFDPDVDTGAEIDLESTGLDDDETSLFIDGRWRFAHRWHLGFTYYGTDRNGSATANGQIEFGELVIPVDGVVDSSFKADIYIADIGYSFVKTPRAELGARLGVHSADLETTLRSRGTVGSTEIEFGSASADVLAPLPNIGLFGTYAFTPQLAISASLGYFSLNYDKYDGELGTATAGLDYRFGKNFGIGLGYSFLDIDLDVDEDTFDERYEFEYQGPVVYVSAGF